MLNNRLRILQGKLVMDDGSSVEEYLKEWQQRVGVADYTAVNLMTRDNLYSLWLDASFSALR